MQKLIFRNGNGKEIDLTAGNYGITNWSGLSNTGLNIQTQQVPFADGGVYLDALMNQREINVTVAIQDNNNLELRYQLKRELISALNPKGGEGVLIYQNDYLARQIHAVPQLPIFENKNSNTSGTLKASVTFSCPDPYWEDLEETEVELTKNKNIVVENKGDVPINIQFDFEISDALNPALQNLTNAQKVQIESEVQNNVRLSTLTGQKEIYEMNNYLDVANGNIKVNDICYAEDKNIFVLVCSTTYQGVLLISENLENFKNIPIENPEDIFNFKRVIYAKEKGLFVAIGNGGGTSNQKGYIYTSTDAINWNIMSVYQTITGRRPYLDIVWSSKFSKFFIVTGTSYMCKSNDGVEWIEESEQAGLSKTLCNGYDGDIVAIGSSGYCTTNGISWSTISGGDGNLNSICYAEDIGYVTVGNNGLIKKGIAYHSPSFNTVQSTITDNLNRVEFIEKKGLFVAVGDNGCLIISDDIDNWRKIEINTSLSLYAIEKTGLNTKVYGDRFIKLSSYDCIEWSTADMWLYKYMTEIYYVYYVKNRNMYVATGYLNPITSTGSDVVCIKENNNEWVSHTTSLCPTKFIYVEERNIFVGIKNSKIYTSADAINWTEKYNNVNSYYLRDLCFFENNGTIIVVGSHYTVITSTDLENWTEMDRQSTTNDLYSICCTDTEIVIVGYNGLELYSEDAINWTDYDTDCTWVTRDTIANRYIGTGTGLNVSQDGKIWKKLKTQGGGSFNRIYMYKNMYIGYDRDTTVEEISDTIYISIDLIHWVKIGEIISAISAYDLIIENGDFILYGVIELLIKQKVGENIINLVSQDTDMNLKLEIGDNTLLLHCENNGGLKGKLTFRQRYVGV